ncbi:MAG: DEAD/DEAH box helicase family protein [bacterium]
MQVKKYLGDNVQELLWQVKSELGEDAVIIHTRKFKEGAFLGIWGGHEKIEVIAATEGIAAKEKEYKKEEKQFEKNFISLERKVSDLYNILDRLTLSAPEKNDADDELNTYLSSQNINLNLQNEIKAEVERGLSPYDAVRECLEQKIVLAELNTAKKPQVIVIAGPTGVGKTTTIAKLTAQYTLLAGKSIALLTADTYRIAAVDQLKTYGQIMNVPVEAVYTPNELKDALKKYADKDIIFLDTAGRNQKNTEQMEELQQFLAVIDEPETVLVLSATTKYEDLQNIVDNFAQINFTHIVFTKLDETESYGSMLSLLADINKPLAYVARGQNVPDDLEPAAYELLLDDLLKGLPK